MGKNNDHVRQALFDKAEKLGWAVLASEDSVEFNQHSPAGEDFWVCIDGRDIASEVKDYADYFDAEEHVRMLLNAKESGYRDVPDLKTLVKDADDIQKMLNELASALAGETQGEADIPATKKVAAVLHEHPMDEGYSRREIESILFDELTRAGIEDDEELIPIMLDGESSSVFGFIRYAAADELLNFRLDQNSDYGAAVVAVLDDMENETEDGIYEFCGVVTKIFR